MAILFALISAIAYGTSDFIAGLLSRRYAAEPASGIVIAFELVFTALGVVLFHGDGPHAAALEWGALGGLGGGAGTLFLYRGLAAGAMAITGTVSGVLAAVLPAIVGLARGNHLSAVSATGIVIAVPAIALVSWSADPQARADSRAGAMYGALAGIGFALQFVALDLAGTRSGAWPALPGQTVALIVVAPFALRGARRAGRPQARDLGLVLCAALLATVAVLLFLSATGKGELSIVAVVAALYPAFTVLLARALLAERWSRLQVTGLLVAAASVILVSVS
jgi:drug/metabolite transporter (DMT)-like permease